MNSPQFAQVILSFAVCAAVASAQGSYTNFESPQVNPIAISPDGTKLLVTNTADARLSIFDLSQPSNPVLIKEIPVGIEPVAVRARTNDEAWVVNHTSDSISIVSISQGIVTDTIYCKDEPCDVVFAGSTQRAYVSASRSNAIKVFDVTTHAQITSISVFGENPRNLAVGADGTRVFATFALSGNRTTIIPVDDAPPPPVPTNQALPLAPQQSIIVDATDPAWTTGGGAVIQYTMPDNDAVEINANNNTIVRYFPRVGTTNTGIAVRPGNGDLYIANTDARNLVRFEPNVRGHIVDNRIAKINISNGAVTHFDLNPGVNYSTLPNPAATALALAQPMGVVFDPSGSFLYLAAFGTDRVAKVDANGNILARIELNPSATGSVANSRTKRGPRGLAYNSASQRLYIQNRISNTISIIHTQTNALINEIPVGAYDPTPLVIREGRGFLYDAKLSGNGNSACSACHNDADIDMIAWDLGNPGGSMQIVTDPAGLFGNISMHPMKGPMLTQSLKGLDPAHDPLHWRGDRSDFTDFNGAFDSLLGGSQLAMLDMVAFRDFIETVKYEPNPNRNLDNTLPASVAGSTGNPQSGFTTFTSEPFVSIGPLGLRCMDCHIPSIGGQAAAIFTGPVLNEEQAFNVPQLRNIYQRNNFNNTPGAQSLSGFGYLHDGSFKSVFDFLTNPVFGTLQSNTTKKNNLQAFLLCFDTGFVPAVGYSRTIRQSNANQGAVTSDVTLLQNQATLANIDLIGKGVIDGVLRGLRYQTGPGNYKTDKTGIGPFTWAQLQSKALAGNATFTLMGVPVGSGQRMGIDRDEDTILDGDEPAANPVTSFGASSPVCAGTLTMGVNSTPAIGNNFFAFTCTNTAPSSLSLGLVGNVADVPGTPFFGFNLHVSFASTELYALDMISDPSGFAVAPIPIPNNPLLVGSTFAGQTISLAGCAPSGLAASQGLSVTIVNP
ncbi:MAG: YncE family protein [Planctomycetota bacterium]